MHISDQYIQPSKSYPQNWRAYNAAQTSEKEQFLCLLRNLCLGTPELPQSNGRPRLPIADALFAICYKIYSTVSGRRFMSDLRDAQIKGYIEKTPHFNSIFNYLENPELSVILQELIVRTSLPLAAVEVDFAADASGFTGSQRNYWCNHVYGKKQETDWVKVHLICGVKTNIVTNAIILGRHTHDGVPFHDLVKTTANNFNIREVSADKGYNSAPNYSTVAEFGGLPFIAFRRNSKDNPKNDVWSKMFHLFKFNEEEFSAHYHKRSNVEATFSMIKAKFGGFVRSKTETAMKNEVFCKIICHNICCLIMESCELGIDINFGQRLMPNHLDI